jgi:hypothetical protein
MRNFTAGFIVAALIFGAWMMIQKISYERKILDTIHVLSEENSRDKREIADHHRISKNRAWEMQKRK